MIKNKQGMSAVVTTLIIILLVIVALGIIWVVVKNVIEGGVEQVDLSTKCREVEVNAVKLTNTTIVGTGYDLTLKRTGAGDEEIGGIKLVFFNDTTNSEVIDFGYALPPLETYKQSVTLTTAVTNANKIDMTVWFLNDLGTEDLCPMTRTKDF